MTGRGLFYGRDSGAFRPGARTKAAPRYVGIASWHARSLAARNSSTETRKLIRGVQPSRRIAPRAAKAKDEARSAPVAGPGHARRPQLLRRYPVPLGSRAWAPANRASQRRVSHSTFSRVM